MTDKDTAEKGRFPTMVFERLGVCGGEVPPSLTSYTETTWIADPDGIPKLQILKDSMGKKKTF